jgi:hypothetical protein
MQWVRHEALRFVLEVDGRMQREGGRRVMKEGRMKDAKGGEARRNAFKVAAWVVRVGKAESATPF